MQWADGSVWGVRLQGGSRYDREDFVYDMDGGVTVLRYRWAPAQEGNNGQPAVGPHLAADFVTSSFYDWRVYFRGDRASPDQAQARDLDTAHFGTQGPFLDTVNGFLAMPGGGIYDASSGAPIGNDPAAAGRPSREYSVRSGIGTVYPGGLAGPAWGPQSLRALQADAEWLMTFIRPVQEGITDMASVAHAAADAASNMSLSDWGHLALDVGGMIPVVGFAFDGANAVWYGWEGNWEQAAFSAAAAVPGAGDAAMWLRWGSRCADATKFARAARAATRLLDTGVNLAQGGVAMYRGIRDGNAAQAVMGGLGIAVNLASIRQALNPFTCFPAGTQVAVGLIVEDGAGRRVTVQSQPELAALAAGPEFGIAQGIAQDVAGGGGAATALRVVGYLTKAIEALEPGEPVLTRDEGDPDAPLCFRPVEAVFRREALGLVRLRLRSSSGAEQTIHTTAEHPVYVINRDGDDDSGGWVAAGELAPGDELLDANGVSAVLSIVRDREASVTQVFNLRVSGTHTYFVREADVEAVPLWVHNARYVRAEKGAKPIHSPDPQRWVNKGGNVWVELDGTWVYKDWEGNVVRYAGGYPDFKEAGFVRQQVPINQRGNWTTDFTDADKAASLGPRLPENTWHHHQDRVHMQEVPWYINNRFTHVGGRSIVHGG